MSELLEIYDLNGKLSGVEERDLFYTRIEAEFHETGKITSKVKTIRVVLLNSQGRIYLQKRSSLKNYNPSLYDKTVGGHVPTGYSFENATTKECAEELGFPATIVEVSDFMEVVKNVDLHVIGIFKKIDFIENYQSVRIDKDRNIIIQPVITAVYLGYYDGAIRFVDGEASGVEVFSLSELQAEINKNPDKFTDDIKFIVQSYSNKLKPLSELSIDKGD